MSLEKLQKELQKAAPHTTLNWEMHIKKRRKKAIIIIIILSSIAGLFVYSHAKKVEAESKLIHTVVAHEKISKGTQITEDHLSMKTYAMYQLPDNFHTEISELIGAYAVQEIPKNAIITDSDTKKTISSESLALELDDTLIAFTINGNWLESTLPKITKGDSVGVLVSNPEREIEDTFFMIQRAEVIDVVRNLKSASSSYVTLEISEEESRNLLFARSHKFLFSIVLTQ